MIKVYKSLVNENEEKMLAYITNGKSRAGQTITEDDIDPVKLKEIKLREGYSDKRADKEVDKIKKPKDPKDPKDPKVKDK